MPKKTTFTTTLDADLLKEAKAMAEKRGVAVGSLIERALDRYLEFLRLQDLKDFRKRKEEEE